MSLDETLLDRFYRHVSHADLLAREPEVRQAIVGQVAELAHRRDPGTAAVRVFNPSRAEDGWTSRHTAVQIVTDNMPFLVDSVLGELSRRELSVHVLVHPQLVVAGEGDTRQVRDVDAADAQQGEAVESWMHLEIDRIPQQTAREDLQARLAVVLQDVRRACADWEPMRAALR